MAADIALMCFALVFLLPCWLSDFVQITCGFSNYQRLATEVRVTVLLSTRIDGPAVLGILVPNTTSLFAAISVVHAVIMIPGLASKCASPADFHLIRSFLPYSYDRRLQRSYRSQHLPLPAYARLANQYVVFSSTQSATS